MTQEYDPEGRAQLYKTPDAQMAKSPRSPVLKMKFVLKGVPYEVALWPATETDRTTFRTDPHGNRFYTGDVKVDTYAQNKMQGQAPPQQPAQQAPPPPTAPTHLDEAPQDAGEEIPF